MSEIELQESCTQAQPLVELLRRELNCRTVPIFIALDGRSGSGKSTIASIVADELNADSSEEAIVTVIEGDQFYGGGSASTWDAISIDQKIDRVIDWQRQRLLLKSLRNQGTAVWQYFDWDSDDWDADIIPLKPQPIRCVATPVVLLEGAYSARPELSDLLDIRVLLNIPTQVRRARLLKREGEAYRDDWERRWAAAEDYYFGSITPAHEYDLVLGQADEQS
ncbi:(d)CMP kinase [Acaryochloris sp. IP29b_bin.148]|uniref:uridine kinase family protein n=1 Tax=Acaryochloris sp. IP29b_bin.148 TaxID=2969218 RepID=UPI00260B3B08|nr:(d)CMP kinase [Acaryochloris sp. IP29b_bin.148]